MIIKKYNPWLSIPRYGRASFVVDRPKHDCRVEPTGWWASLFMVFFGIMGGYLLRQYASSISCHLVGIYNAIYQTAICCSLSLATHFKKGTGS